MIGNSTGAILRRVLVLALLAGPAACTGADTTQPATRPSWLPADVANIVFATFDMNIKNRKFTLEAADSDDKVERGLMYRPSMALDHGMLFIFDTPGVEQFWMKNTKIPLDIIFIDPAGKVVEIDDRKPLDETGMGPTTPIQYVIELNEGIAKQIDLKVGDSVSIPAKYLKRSTSSSDK